MNIVGKLADCQSRKGIDFLRKAVGEEKAWVAQMTKGARGCETLACRLARNSLKGNFEPADGIQNNDLPPA
jgi:hypothetical protein